MRGAAVRVGAERFISATTGKLPVAGRGGAARDRIALAFTRGNFLED